MILRLTISKDSEAVDTVRVDSDVKVVAIGNATDAMVTLPDLPKTAAEIRRGTSLSLLRIDDDVELTVDGEPVKGDAEIRNGSTLTIGPYSVLATVQFERATHNSRNSIAVLLTVFLIVAIIIMEILVVNWLPRRISQSELFGGEILRQRTLYQMDRVRLAYIAGALKKKSLDPLVRQGLMLYKGEADRMALYLRNNHSKMSLSELKVFAGDLALMENQLRMLARGQLIPPSQPVKFTEQLHEELKEKEEQP